MKDDIDIEDVLKRYRSDPDSRVKQSVLSRFTRTFGSRKAAGNIAGFWKRPIPLYLVFTGIIIVIGLSFFAGQRMSTPDRSTEAPNESLQNIAATAVQEVKWEVAPNDLF